VQVAPDCNIGGQPKTAILLSSILLVLQGFGRQAARVSLPNEQKVAPEIVKPSLHVG
jgi:hypothetical protein